MNQLCLMIGPPFAEDKTQTMQSTGASLGLTHDPSCINKTGHVRFWARTRLHGKVRDFLPQHVKQATLLEAQLPNFIDLQSSWSKVFLGESGMAVSWPSRHATGALYGVVCALIERPDLFRHRHGLWFLDNVAAVMTLVRGRSSNSGLAKLGHLIHLALFALRAQHLRVPHTCHEYGLTF